VSLCKVTMWGLNEVGYDDVDGMLHKKRKVTGTNALVCIFFNFFGWVLANPRLEGGCVSPRSRVSGAP